MSYETNPYYNPEAVGAERIGELERPNLSYAFSIFLVLREKATGLVFFADDSGCSCPSPFEDHEFPRSFVCAPSADVLKAAIFSWGKDFDGHSFVDRDEVDALARKAFP